MVIAGELLLVLVVCLATLALARRRAPFPILAVGVRRMLARREYRGPLLCIAGVIVFDVIQSQLDSRITAVLGYDVTPLIRALEGDWAARLQALEWLPATWLFAFAYIVVLPALIVAPAMLAASDDDLAAYRAILLGFAWNYAIALPFYVFVPVKEMWAGNPEAVRLLVDRLSPAIMEAYRANSAIDNCFPSLHTSFALTTAIVVSRLGPRPLAPAAWVAAVLVVLSTLYLGIHWLSDVAAGAVLAAVVGRIVVGKVAAGPAGRTAASSGAGEAGIPPRVS